MQTPDHHLLLLRHGKASWQQPVSDFDRSLTDKGRMHVQKLAAWMNQQSLSADRVVSSPTLRCRMTAELLCQHLSPPIPLPTIEFDARIYEAEPADLLMVLRAMPDECGRILLVGHNPGLELLISQLTGLLSEPILPATLIELAVTGNWSELGQQPVRLIRIEHGKHLE